VPEIMVPERVEGLFVCGSHVLSSLDLPPTLGRPGALSSAQAAFPLYAASG